MKNSLNFGPHESFGIAKDRFMSAQHFFRTEIQKEMEADELSGIRRELAFLKEEKEMNATALVLANLQKAEVEQYKLIIEEKNKNITDSINYARRIQRAILPGKEAIYTDLGDSFVLFKPKDIVSGDFYFHHKHKDSILIAAADCTGHGVPGAFMSIMGLEKLHATIPVHKDPADILKCLNNGIKTSLQQSESHEFTADGMDIALCSINTTSRRVEFAGANRPLWIIRKGQNTVEEIKGTKKEIGGTSEFDQCYESHSLELEEGDAFYIFSDGYADTFSGQSAKKLTTKRFKQTLLEIQGKPMQEQQHYLNDFVEIWKAGAEQIDDILVIGVRL